MNQYYFGQACVHVEEGIEVPQDWQIFEKEKPYRYEVTLRASEDKPVVAADQCQCYDQLRIVKDKRGEILFAESNHVDSWEDLIWALQNEKTDKEEETNIRVRLRSNLDYTDNVLYYRETGRDILYFHNSFEAAITMHGGSILHASCIVYQGQAVLFCGPSGMGKSTQARLWMKYKGAHMLSSDAPAIFFDKERAVAYGMPWDGSDHIIRQEAAPIRAIVRLAQGKEDTLRPLSIAEAYETLLHQGHMPLWDDRLMPLELRFLKELAGKTEMYDLTCTPTEKAVQVLYDTIFK